MQPLSLYVHIPFCAARCGYCDFNSYAGQESLIPDDLRALFNNLCSIPLRPGTAAQEHNFLHYIHYQLWRLFFFRPVIVRFTHPVSEEVAVIPGTCPADSENVQPGI